VKLKGRARYSNGIDTQVKKYWLLISNGLNFASATKDRARNQLEKSWKVFQMRGSVQGIG
jgi:hypothetical protein